ncbi:mothers against decapentaplegic homolog 6-like [Lampris incognitus]|uniref:mothers against decapentaplegic homolog 6-like n=1 Tax=Lampris incognitus TaxID=2546036 RepID=UPI0024B50E58|nr:mothers against decapentaplegic homolog 6-like [Lampris incognitus]
MFRSKRSGLIRRLWRSRLVTDSDGRDGSKRSEAGPDGSRGSNPEKFPRTARRSVTHPEPSPGTPFGEVSSGGPGDSTEQEDSSDNEPGAMCIPQHRGSGQGQENDSGTVTCCLFREWDLRPRSPYSALRKDRGCSCRCSPGHAGSEGDSLPVVEQELKNAAYALLKRLKEKPLEALQKAVETKGGLLCECVMVPQTDLRLSGHQISPQYLLCKLYRWSDLQHTAHLKALCHCQSFGTVDNAKVCCNPYHYSRLCGPESPPPPYSVSCSDEHKPLDSPLSYTETVPLRYSNSPHVTPRDYTDTGTSLGSSSSSGRRSHWCSVAYWEQRTRVGRLYPAHEPSLSIFYDLPQGTGLCLGQLQTSAYYSHCDDAGSRGIQALHSSHSRGGGGSGGNSSSCTANSVQQIRSKIGYGIVLSREPDGVWVYNRSQHPVFVHSPTLDLPSVRGLSVKRVMPGYSLKVFDYERSSWILENGVKPESQEGPWDPHSVRISFAKGWGPCYSRQFITSCPCWLEVLLNNHR